MTNKNSFATLFEPVDIGSLKLPNRIVMAPMTRGFAPGGVLDSKAIDYYRRRAEGGVGLIITEGAATCDIGAYASNVPSLYGDKALAAWRPVVEGVHAAGGHIMVQLWHTGLGRIRPSAHDPSQASIGPVANYLPTPEGKSGDAGWEGGRAMTQADIDGAIDAYASAALNAKNLGFDGIELHGAHGYLIDEFLWDQLNTRTDKYGGSVENRSRFASEVVSEIRRRCGATFPIGFRFSQWKLPTLWDARLAKTPQELEKILAPIVDAGVTFFDCSTRRYWEPAFEGDPRNLSGWTRKLTGVPTMTVGSIGLDGPLMGRARVADTAQSDLQSLEPLIGMIERQEVDLVGVGRALIANPDWANNVREGRESELHAYSAESLTELY